MHVGCIVVSDQIFGCVFELLLAVEVVEDEHGALVPEHLGHHEVAFEQRRRARVRAGYEVVVVLALRLQVATEARGDLTV